MIGNIYVYLYIIYLPNDILRSILILHYWYIPKRKLYQHQLEMQLSRPSHMRRLGFSKFMEPNLSIFKSLNKNFLQTFLMIRQSTITLRLWCLSEKGELLHLYGRQSGFVKNKSKSRLLKIY